MPNIKNFIVEYIRDIILFLLVLVCLFITMYNSYFKEEKVNMNEIAILNEPEKIAQEETNIKEEVINVDIKGAVKKPGVYQVKSGTIINDVVTLAGGFNSNAYKNGVNLSKKVNDEMVVFVYTKAEINSRKEASTTKQTSTSNETCKTPTYDICECIDERESIIENNPNSSTLEEKNEDDNNQLVNINTAQKQELTTLTGIGDSKAQAIIDYRSEVGNFANITDIMNVSGIGEALFAKIKNFITI